MDRIEKATQNHVDIIAPNIRKCDIDEVFASSGKEIHEVLTESLKVKGKHYALIIDDDVICLFGCADCGDVGVVWLLGTDMIEQHKNIFCKYSVKYINKFKKKYKYLVNFVSKNNIIALKWLQWLGFTIHSPEPYGYLQESFCKCDMEVK